VRQQLRWRHIRLQQRKEAERFCAHQLERSPLHGAAEIPHNGRQPRRYDGMWVAADCGLQRAAQPLSRHNPQVAAARGMVVPGGRMAGALRRLCRAVGQPEQHRQVREPNTVAAYLHGVIRGEGRVQQQHAREQLQQALPLLLTQRQHGLWQIPASGCWAVPLNPQHVARQVGDVWQQVLECGVQLIS
jgi:hypothetical protein